MLLYTPADTNPIETTPRLELRANQAFSTRAVIGPRGANLTGARLSAATLDGVNLAEAIGWAEIGSISYASIEGVRSPPDGFIVVARGQGAVERVTPPRSRTSNCRTRSTFRIV